MRSVLFAWLSFANNAWIRTNSTLQRRDAATQAFFFLTASNYMVQVVRESFTVYAGKESSARMLAVTAVASGVISFTMTRASRYRSETELVFYLVLLWTLLIFLSSVFLDTTPESSKLFFVLSHIATLMTSSFLWGLVNSKELKLQTCLGVFSKAATFGQAFGSILSWFSIQILQLSGFRTQLMLACGLSGLATLSVRKLTLELHEDGRLPAGNSIALSLLRGREKSRYLTLLGAFQIMNCMATSLVYLTKLDVLSSYTPSEVSLFSSKLNTLSAVLVLLVQLSGAPDHLSITLSLSLLPVITGTGLLLLKFFYASTDLFILASLVLSSRVASYAISKVSRERLYSVLPTADRLLTKPLFDGFLCKVGTTLASAFHLMTNDATVYSIWFIAWFGVSLALGRESQIPVSKKS